MKKTGFILFAALVVIACKKKDEIIVPDPDFIPPVEEVKFTNNGTFHFGFGNSGSFRFSTDVVNQYKVIINKTDYYGPTPTPTVYTFKFANDYLLQELETLNAAGQKSTLKFYYTNGFRLIRIEDWGGNTLYNTYSIAHEDNAAGRKITIAPYVVSNGAGYDTLSHILQVDYVSQVIGVYQRSRQASPSSGLSIDSFAVYYSPQNVYRMRGYSIYANPGFSVKDSSRINYYYSRTPNENPVLVEYLSRLYGSDFYNILHYCTLLRFHQGTVSTASDFLMLTAQKKTSETQYQYTADVYSNGVFTGTQSGTRIRENTLDAQNRLIKSKVYGTPPNYYTWEIVYK